MLKRRTAFLTASMGPTPIIAGSTPAWPQETIFPNGCSARCLTTSELASTTAAAPSLIPKQVDIYVKHHT